MTPVMPIAPVAPMTQEAADRELLLACERGQLGRVKSLLKGGANARALSQFKNTALHLAVCNSDREPVRVKIVQLLVARGANLEAPNAISETPLHYAAESSALAASELLKSGAKAAVYNDTGWSPLHSAAKNADVSLLTQLLTHGADPVAQSNDGTTALYAAAQNGHAHIAAVLIDAVDEACRADVRKACKNQGWHSVTAVFQARDARLAIEEIMAGKAATPQEPEKRAHP